GTADWRRRRAARGEGAGQGSERGTHAARQAAAVRRRQQRLVLADGRLEEDRARGSAAPGRDHSAPPGDRRAQAVARRRGHRGWSIVPAMATSPFSLEGKTAIVTGGGTGIGKSIAIEFARAGADVALCSRKLEHLEPVAKEIGKLGRRTFAVAVDVRQEDQVKAMVERAVSEWGRLDIMVNNAGASFRAKPEDISINGWNTVIGINLNGVFLGCKWAGKQMMQQKTGGVIVNIASIAGVY